MRAEYVRLCRPLLNLHHNIPYKFPHVSQRSGTLGDAMVSM